MAEGTSSTKKGILIGCGIALALGVCGIGSCFALCGGGAFYLMQQTEAPASEARAFLSTFSQEDIPGTLSHTSAGFKARVSEERLKQLASEQAPALKGFTDVTFNQRAITGEHAAQLGGTVTSPTGATGVEFQMVEEGKAWRVDAASVAGRALE
jgi:hypothetical protein